jgi:competence protein ComEC
VLLEAPRGRSFGRWAAIARLRDGPGRGERVLVRGGGRHAFAVGAEVLVRGGYEPLPVFEAAARRRGAHALLAADAVVPTGRRRGGVAGALDGVRARAERTLATGLPPRLAALARGMVLGQDEALPAEMRDDFRASGLAHLLAASGANVALLVALVLALAGAAGLPLRARWWAAGAAVVAYVPLAGGGPSIQRAGVMGVAALVAALASRPAARWYALLLAAAVTLAANPRALEDPGWQLSFAAVVSLLVLAPRLRTRLAPRLPGPVADAAAITTAATLGTAPLMAAHFGAVSLAGLPANVLAAPAVAPVMWLGTIASVLGQAAPALAAPVLAAAAWPLAFLAWLAHAAASVPHAQVAAGAGSVVVVLAALALAARRGPRAARVRRRLALPVAALAAAGGALALAAPGPHPPPGLVVSALDVGQGDATLVQHGAHALLVDAGPPDGPIVRRLREAGVRRLDLLVVTHAQADHDGGAAAVLRAFPVGLVLDGRDGVASADGARLAGAARERGVGLLAPAAGQLLRAGPLALRVLSPRPEPAARHAGADPNQRAIVAELRDGAFSLLLTADAESDVTAGLALAPVDVLKVAHHGSADPGLPALLTRLRPAVALIEVGEGNTYGHPAPSTLEALRGVPRVLRTDRDGTVRVRPGAGGLVVERRR